MKEKFQKELKKRYLKMIATRKKIIYRKRKKGPIYKKKWFWKLVFIFLIIAVLFWLAFGMSFFDIKKIEIFSPARFKPAIKKELSQEKNIFLLNSAKISKSVQKEFPQIEGVEVEKKLPSTISVKVKQRKAFGVFCLTEEKFQCFLMSNDGTIYKRQNPTKKYLLFVMQDSKKPNLGDVVIKEALMENIIFLLKELKKIKISATKIDISSFEVEVFTKENFKIFFSKDNLQEQIEVFIKIFKETLKPKEKKALKYIDLRSLEEGKKGPIYWK